MLPPPHTCTSNSGPGFPCPSTPPTAAAPSVLAAGPFPPPSASAGLGAGGRSLTTSPMASLGRLSNTPGTSTLPTRLISRISRARRKNRQQQRRRRSKGSSPHVSQSKVAEQSELSIARPRVHLLHFRCKAERREGTFVFREQDAASYVRPPNPATIQAPLARYDMIFPATTTSFLPRFKAQRKHRSTLSIVATKTRKLLVLLFLLTRC